MYEHFSIYKMVYFKIKFNWNYMHIYLNLLCIGNSIYLTIEIRIRYTT